MLGMLELEHLAGEQLALAGTAAAGLARERERQPGAQQRGEQRVALPHRHRLAVALEDDLHGRPGDGTKLFGGQTKSSSPGCCPVCSATGCAWRSRRDSATTRAPFRRLRRAAPGSSSWSTRIPA